MRRGWKWILGGLVIFVAGFFAGGYFGVHRLWKVVEPMMRSEVELSLSSGVDELLFLRAGKLDKALLRLEWRLDGAILGLLGGRALTEVSPEELQKLLLAKKYRARYPFARASPEAQAVLAAVPDGPLDPIFLKTAARVLMQEAGTSTEPAELAGSAQP